MYIIRTRPMSTRLAKDSARAVVASEQASAIRASNFRTMCFMVVRLSPSIHLRDVRQLPQITPSHFLLDEAQKLYVRAIDLKSRTWARRWLAILIGGLQSSCAVKSMTLPESTTKIFPPERAIPPARPNLIGC